MRIRLRVGLLVAAVLVPVALLAGVSLVWLWSLQREAYEQRYLERVSALRLALDTDLEATVRLLGAFGNAREIGLDGPPLPDLMPRLERRLQSHPEWAALGVVDAEGRGVVAASRAGASVPPPTPAMLARDGDGDGGRDGAASDVVTLGDGRHVAYIAAAMREGGVLRGWVWVAAPSEGWLEFLRRYPISPDATLTLNDRQGLILARTLNNERWVGRKSTANFLEQLVGRDEGAFFSRGLEGQRFYSAFSRSRVAGWTVGTGVPSSSVEAALRDSTIAIAAGIVVAALAAALLALRFGSRIVNAMAELESDAERVLDRPGAADAAGRPLAIAEAEHVRQALRRASTLLAARDAERDAAFASEAEARAEAERSNAAKDEFIAMLGHELRNPLSAIKSASTLLAMPDIAPTVGKRSHDVIERQIGRLTDLIDDMLDTARLNSGKIVLQKKAVDLAAIAGHVAASFADAGRCRHLAVDLALAPAWTFGDETRLEQVVANLYDNACKYTPHGGRVRIETATDAAGETVRLVVSDDGSGIAAELLPRVFDVFAQGARTLERSEGGLGLGLTVVRRLVLLHGGSVVAESDGPGRGSRFRVVLAAANPPDAAAKAAPGAAGPAAADAAGATEETTAAPASVEPRRIVVVEDDPDNRDLYRLLLEEEGWQVSVAADGIDGIAAVLADRPQVAIVDIGLPGVDGFEVARRIRADARGEKIRLIAVTGYGTPADRERALEAGFDAFLRKPFDLEAFQAIAAEAPSPPRR